MERDEEGRRGKKKDGGSSEERREIERGEAVRRPA